MTIDGNVVGGATTACPMNTFEFEIHSAEETSAYFIQGSILRYVSLQRSTIIMQVSLATAEGKSTKGSYNLQPNFLWSVCSINELNGLKSQGIKRSL
jgi:hypothetical protein